MRHESTYCFAYVDSHFPEIPHTWPLLRIRGLPSQYSSQNTHKLLSISRNDIQCSYCSGNKPPKSGAFKLLEMASCERRKRCFSSHIISDWTCSHCRIVFSRHFETHWNTSLKFLLESVMWKMASVMTEAKTGGKSSSWSSTFFTLWFTKGNYTSALLHERTANFRSYGVEIIHGWENLGFFIINPTPKPNVCSYQKHPFNHARTHTPPFSLLGFYIARKQPSSNIPPTFITALRCPIFLCQVTAPSQLVLNVALHKFLVSFALCVMLMGHQSYSAIKTGHHSDREGFKLKASQGRSGWKQFDAIQPDMRISLTRRRAQQITDNVFCSVRKLSESTRVK